MVERFYPPATWDPAAKSGGSMLGGGPARGTLHTTETRGFASRDSGYHLQVRYDAGRVEWRQHIHLDVAARSLRNLDGGVQTNRQGLWHPQVGIVWYAADAANMPAPLLEAIAEFMRWAEAQYGILPAAPPEHLRGGDECYGYSSPCRFTNQEWVDWPGWSAHQNPPENTHWDCGPIPWDRLINDGGWSMAVTPSSSREDIAELQELMVLCEGYGEAEMRKGARSDDVDGLWGPSSGGGGRTSAALATLRALRGLPPDGLNGRGDYVTLSEAGAISKLNHWHAYFRPDTGKTKSTTRTSLPWPHVSVNAMWGDDATWRTVYDSARAIGFSEEEARELADAVALLRGW